MNTSSPTYAELRDRLARLLYDTVRESRGGYVEDSAENLAYTTVDGMIDFGHLADTVIEHLGLINPADSGVSEGWFYP